VEYRIGWERWESEWVCVEHSGYARAKAESWWRQRTDLPVPDSAEEAVDVAREGGLCKTYEITVKSTSGEKYDEITGYRLGPKPVAPGYALDFDGTFDLYVATVGDEATEGGWRSLLRETVTDKDWREYGEYRPQDWADVQVAIKKQGGEPVWEMEGYGSPLEDLDPEEIPF
jgi:hypothetical protein